ncbi:MAG: hypothetical protein EAZ50_09500 [Runella slithyformis]|nr:MAG: hypothetical protein EAZ50_09500 [Runella slithyformis]
MEKLAKDWITQGWLDFEYKKYVILAYLQQVQHNFKEQKLFPDLTEIAAHYQHTHELKQSKEAIQAAFPRQITGIDWQKMELMREATLPDEPHPAEIDQIVEYTLPRLKNTLTAGWQQYNDIESQVTFRPVGIVPLQLNDGYLFIYRASQRQAEVYKYQIRLFNNQAERYVHTFHVETIQKNASTTFENLKINLVKKHRDLPNPATYLVESARQYPVAETLLPIAKKMVAKEVALG